MWKIFRLLCAWLPAALLCPALAHAAAPVIELSSGIDVDGSALTLAGRAEYWIDDGAALTAQDVAQRGDQLLWRPVAAGVRYPIDGKVLWMRLSARMPLASEPWFLVLPYSGLDRAVMYTLGPDSDWPPQEAGDSVPVADWPLPGRFPTFLLNSESRGQIAFYLLRLEQARISLSVTPWLQSRHALVASREREHLLQGAYFGLVVATALLALALALAWRERVFVQLALYVGATGFAELAHLGLGAQHVWHWWPDFNRLSTFILGPLANTTGLWLMRTVAVPSRSWRWLDRAVLATLVMLPTAALLDTLLLLPLTRMLTGWLMLISLGLLIAMLVAAWRRHDDPQLSLVALAWAPMLLALAPLLALLELIPAGVLTRYGISLASLLQMPMLLYALSLRSSTRREALARQQAMATTDPLTGLSLEHVLLLRLDATLRRAWKENLPFSLIVARVYNLQQIVAAGGQRAGERALVFTAADLRRHARTHDAVARIGEQDFALLMEAPFTPVQAQAVISQLRQTLHRQAERLPPHLRPQVDMAHAALLQDTLDARVVLTRLLQGLPVPGQDTPAARPPDTTSRRPVISHLNVS